MILTEGGLRFLLNPPGGRNFVWLKILLFLTHLRSRYPFLDIYKWFWEGLRFCVLGLRSSFSTHRPQHLGNEANVTLRILCAKISTLFPGYFLNFTRCYILMTSPWLGRFLVSFNLICDLQFAVCSLRSAVCKCLLVGHLAMSLIVCETERS